MKIKAKGRESHKEIILAELSYYKFEWAFPVPGPGGVK